MMAATTPESHLITDWRETAPSSGLHAANGCAIEIQYSPLSPDTVQVVFESGCIVDVTTMMNTIGVPGGPVGINLGLVAGGILDADSSQAQVYALPDGTQHLVVGPFDRQADGTVVPGHGAVITFDRDSKYKDYLVTYYVDPSGQTVSYYFLPGSLTDQAERFTRLEPLDPAAKKHKKLWEILSNPFIVFITTGVLTAYTLRIMHYLNKGAFLNLQEQMSQRFGINFEKMKVLTEDQMTQLMTAMFEKESLSMVVLHRAVQAGILNRPQLDNYNKRISRLKNQILTAYNNQHEKNLRTSLNQLNQIVYEIRQITRKKQRT